MTDEEIDVSSLDEFEKSMGDRIDELEAILSSLNSGELLSRPLPSGTFVAGKSYGDYYEEDRQALNDRIEELKQATKAIKKASAAIAEQYTTTEEQNTLNSEQVGGVLDGAGVIGTEGDK